MKIQLIHKYRFHLRNVFPQYKHFIGYRPPHKCSSLTQSVYSHGIPGTLNESELTVHYGQCDITISSNITNMTSQQWKLPCVDGYTYDTDADTLVSEVFILLSTHRHYTIFLALILSHFIFKI